VEEGERDHARALYEWLVVLSGHLKPWISFALFEAEAMRVGRNQREEDDEEDEED
jgi:crooked neck